MKKGICHICSKNSVLTHEHVPPKAAFNNSSDLLSYQFDNSTKQWKQTATHPYGVGEYTLCSTCNTQTGGTYGQAFCDFVNFIAEATKSHNEFRKPITIKYRGFLHRIYKQILTMFCSINSEEFSPKNNLAKYLLDINCTDFPKDIRVYIFLVNRQSKLASGISGHINTTTGQTIILSEILFWPLGYILSFDEIKPTDLKGAFLTEITDWRNFEINKRQDVEITLFKNYRLVMFPLDFRSKDEIESTSGQPLPPPGQFPCIDYEI